MKKIIVTADDYGMCDEVNKGRRKSEHFLGICRGFHKGNRRHADGGGGKYVGNQLLRAGV